MNRILSFVGYALIVMALACGLYSQFTRPALIEDLASPGALEHNMEALKYVIFFNTVQLSLFAGGVLAFASGFALSAYVKRKDAAARDAI